jgi:hypothetical protein
MPIAMHDLASQVEEGSVVLERCKSERQVCLGRVGVLQSVPENVTLAEKRAANLVVVALGVLERGNSSTRDRANARPSSLGNPDGLSARYALSLSETGVEVLAGLLDGVGAGRLEVGEGVVTKPDDRVSNMQNYNVEVVQLTSSRCWRLRGSQAEPMR